MRTGMSRLASALLGFLLCGAGTLSYSESHKIELAVQCQGSSLGATQLRITLRNAGSVGTAIVIGSSIGNGQRYVADFVALDVKRDSNSAVEEFRPDLGRIAGRVDPWIVTLPAMSEFSFLQPISGYYSSSTIQPLEIGSGIDVRLRWVAPTNPPFGGELVGGDLVRVFTGEAMTEWLRLRDQCRAA
jgi:hypothetical protein